MHSKLSYAASAAALLVSGTSAMTMAVQVGTSAGGNVFSPSTMIAAVGDVIEFDFSNANRQHSVAQSSFDTPCTPIGSGFFSGVQTGAAVDFPTFSITVTDLNPIYFYCTVSDHCMQGMVGIINPLSTMDEDDFVASAQDETAVTAPDTVGTAVATAAALPADMTSTPMPTATDTGMDMATMTSSTETDADMSMDMPMSTPTTISSTTSLTTSVTVHISTMPMGTGGMGPAATSKGGVLYTGAAEATRPVWGVAMGVYGMLAVIAGYAL